MTPEQKEQHNKVSRRWYANNPPTAAQKAQRKAAWQKWRQKSPVGSAERSQINTRRRERYGENGLTPAQKEAQRVYHKRRYPLIKEKIRESHLRNKYGLSVEAVDAMKSNQNGLCALCKGTFQRTPHVDHDHETGRVRGLLCNKCNTVLGFVESMTFDWLQSLPAYLSGVK